MIAWKQLETCRPIGLVAGLIPWDAMVRWCEIHDLDDSSAYILIDALCYADALDFKERTKKTPTPQKKGRRT